LKKSEADKKSKIVNPLIKKWRGWLLLNEWYIGTGFVEEDRGDSPFQTIAEIEVNAVYKKAHIDFYPRFFRDPKHHQEKTVIHELCHCIMQPASDVMRAQHNGVTYHRHQHSDIIETMTQRMTNAVYLIAKNY